MLRERLDWSFDAWLNWDFAFNACPARIGELSDLRRGGNLFRGLEVGGLGARGVFIWLSRCAR